MEVEIVGLSTFHLESDKLVVDLFEFVLIVIESPLLKNSAVESPEEFEDGEVDGTRSLFPFLMLCTRKGEGDHRELCVA